MKQILNFHLFCDGFSNSRKDNFSYCGKRALYDYLIEYEESTDNELEFDPIDLCCEYTEYATAWEAMEQYQPEDMPTMGEDGDDLVEIQEKNEAEALNWLEERTMVIKFDVDNEFMDSRTSGVIIQNF